MSSERRAHWDAALIDAVRTAMRPRILTISDSVDTYAVIAAVEDWQKAHPSLDRKDRAAFSDLIATFAARAESAELQVQAVRELCRSAIDESYLSDGSIARAAIANRVLLLLDDERG